MTLPFGLPFTFPYLHPLSLLSGVAVIWALRTLWALSRQDGRYVLDVIGWGRALLAPVVPIVLFSLVSQQTDPGVDTVTRFVNMLLGAVTTLPLYVLTLFFSDASSIAESRNARSFTRYRPARLKKVRPSGANVTRSTAALLAAVVVATGVFGVRFGEHLRARALVPSLPSEFGPVQVTDANNDPAGSLLSGTIFRAGELMCPDVKVDLLTPDGEVIRLSVTGPDDPQGVGMREHNIIENAWTCDAYAATPVRTAVPPELWEQWQDLPALPKSLPLTAE